MIVIVLGMHRSGTSALTGMLHENGIVMGSKGEFYPPPMKENPKGFFENRRFRMVNDGLLRLNDYRVKSFDPKVPRVFNPGMFRGEMQGLLREFNRKYINWGWKDPRTCLTLYAWYDCIYSCGLIDQLKVIVTCRHPGDIAESMRQRGNKEEYEGQFEQLVNEYYKMITLHLKKTKCESFTVMFDQLINDPEWVARKLTFFLDYGITNTSHIDPNVCRVGVSNGLRTYTSNDTV